MKKKPPSQLKYRPPRPEQASKYAERYVRVDRVPDDVQWKPCQGLAPQFRIVLFEYSIGRWYKRLTNKRTGEVQLYARKDIDKYPARPAEEIDAEPRREWWNIRVGLRCWYIARNARWYLVEVVSKTKKPPRITIKPVAQRDAEGIAEWPYDAPELEIHGGNGYQPTSFKQWLKPLKARKL